jgi:hypothetical protein
MPISHEHPCRKGSPHDPDRAIGYLGRTPSGALQQLVLGK